MQESYDYDSEEEEDDQSIASSVDEEDEKAKDKVVSQYFTVVQKQNRITQDNKDMAFVQNARSVIDSGNDFIELKAIRERTEQEKKEVARDRANLSLERYEFDKAKQALEEEKRALEEEKRALKEEQGIFNEMKNAFFVSIEAVRNLRAYFAEESKRLSVFT